KMIGTPTFVEEFIKIKNQETHEEKLIALLETFLSCFPVLNAYLCRYSPIGYLAEGVVAIENGKIIYIHEERYDVRTLPVIMTAIQNREANFVHGKDLFKLTCSHHVLSQKIQAFLVTPIVKEGNVIGLIYSNKFKNEDLIPELLNSISEFSVKVEIGRA